MRLESFRLEPELLDAIERVRVALELSRSGYVRRALRLAVRFDERLLQQQERLLSEQAERSLETKKPA